MGGVIETDQVFANGEKCLSVMVVCVKRFNLDATMCDLRIFAKGGLMDPPLRACNMASSRSKYERICQCLIMSFGAHRTDTFVVIGRVEGPFLNILKLCHPANINIEWLHWEFSVDSQYRKRAWIYTLKIPSHQVPYFGDPSSYCHICYLR